MKRKIMWWVTPAAVLLLIVAVTTVASEPTVEAAQAPPRSQATTVGQNAVPLSNEYYVTGRYFCVDNSDGSDRGSCDRTTYANSCQEALRVQQEGVNNADPCKYCTQGVTDNTKHWSKRVQWIHLGPCRGFPN
jgi:hypothetical protein